MPYPHARQQIADHLVRGDGDSAFDVQTMRRGYRPAEPILRFAGKLLPASQRGGRSATLLGDDDPYLPLARQLAAARGDSITVEEVAQAVADTLEDPDPPLRLPVGRPAATLLAARHATADDVPFRIAPLRW